MSNVTSRVEQNINNLPRDAGESRAADYRALVRALNDSLRRTGAGGRMVMTAGVAALSRDEQLGIVAAVQAFDAFDPTDDSYGEHDFGALRIGVHHIIFKVDYYDRSMRVHSPDPSDPAVTARVMIIMLAEEY